MHSSSALPVSPGVHRPIRRLISLAAPSDLPDPPCFPGLDSVVAIALYGVAGYEMGINHLMTKCKLNNALCDKFFLRRSRRRLMVAP